MQAETAPSRKTGTSRSRETARKVLETEAEAGAALIPRLDQGFDHAIELLVSCTGRMVLTGMGKSGIIVPHPPGRRTALGDTILVPRRHECRLDLPSGFPPPSSSA